jgi:hypothetical protein
MAGGALSAPPSIMPEPDAHPARATTAASVRLDDMLRRVMGASLDESTSRRSVSDDGGNGRKIIHRS